MCSCRNVFEALTRDSEVPPAKRRLFEEFSEGKYFYFSLINQTIYCVESGRSDQLPIVLDQTKLLHDDGSREYRLANMYVCYTAPALPMHSATILCSLSYSWPWFIRKIANIPLMYGQQDY